VKRSVLLVLLLWLPLSLLGQIRVERDRDGRIVATNQESAEAGPCSPSRALAAAGLTVTSEERREIEAKLRNACREKGLDFKMVKSLVEAESSFQPYTLSHKGAVGLMQLMPGTAERFGVKDSWNLDQNIEGGTSYLKFLQELFSGDVPLILAGYNAGENAVRKYGGKIPPYAETVRYVFKILHSMGDSGMVARARNLLTDPGDYERYYLSRQGRKTSLRVYYMYFDERGIRHLTDSPPGGVRITPIVYKDD